MIIHTSNGTELIGVVVAANGNVMLYVYGPGQYRPGINLMEIVKLS